MYNPNWARWIKASVNKHFDDRRNNLFMFVEGSNRVTSTKQSYFELRVDGPKSMEISRNFYKLEIEINAVVNTIMGGKKLYNIDTATGFVASIFTRTINIYNYGGETGDDSSFVGCLRLKQEFRDKLIITNLGQIDPNTRINRSIVEGHYYTELVT